MKNNKGETLPQPYLDLARMRRGQQGFDYHPYNDYEKTGDMAYAFDWSVSPENGMWWGYVYQGGTPDLPAASLAELEAWRKDKLSQAASDAWIGKQPEPADNWKAMYEHILKQYEGVILDFQKHLDETPTRNWVAECAMAILSNTPAGVDASWDLSEAWAAEGRKRGHLPKTGNA